MPTAGSGQDVLTSRRRGGRACLMGCGGARQSRPLRACTTAARLYPNRPRTSQIVDAGVTPGPLGTKFVITNVMAWSERRGRLGEPSGSAYVALYTEVIHDARERQLHDEDRTCGCDPRIPD